MRQLIICCQMIIQSNSSDPKQKSSRGRLKTYQWKTKTLIKLSEENMTRSL